MNEYMFLTPQGARQIRMRRIRELEGDHFGALLLREEDPEDASLGPMIAELERRIEHHRAALADEADQQEGLPPQAEEANLGEPG